MPIPTWSSPEPAYPPKAAYPPFVASQAFSPKTPIFSVFSARKVYGKTPSRVEAFAVQRERLLEVLGYVERNARWRNGLSGRNSGVGAVDVERCRRAGHWVGVATSYCKALR